MDISDQENLWQAQRQSHSNDKSTGVSGFGAKPSINTFKRYICYIYVKKSKWCIL